MLSEARLPDRRTADDEETHMVTDALAPAAVTTRIWRVTTDSVDAAPTLRDYLQKELGMAMIFVTHDLGVVADICDRA